MRLMIVTHFLPFPPDDGGRIGYFNAIKYLGRRHEVFVASMVSDRDLEFVEGLRGYCAHVESFPWRKPNPLQVLRNWTSGVPGTAANYFEASLGVRLQYLVQRYSIELVQLEHLNTAAYLPFVNQAPVILREHNAEYRVWERHGQLNNSLESLLVRSLAPSVRRYEARVLPQFSRCITVSPVDRDALLAIAPTAKIECIPSGVDSEYFAPQLIQEEPASMVMTGSFGWIPKQHNLRVLVTLVFPEIKRRLPEAKLCIVGKDVPSDVKDLESTISGLRVVGPVPDVRPYVAKSALVLNFLESGGGIALKMLEALAMKKPVLSTLLGREGVEGEAGKHFEVADSRQDFINKAVILLNDQAKRDMLACGGYDHVRRTYAWSHLVSRFEECYESVVSGCPTPAADRS
jgi:polysaccharide biosynthesis protein PslH